MPTLAQAKQQLAAGGPVYLTLKGSTSATGATSATVAAVVGGVVSNVGWPAIAAIAVLAVAPFALIGIVGFSTLQPTPFILGVCPPDVGWTYVRDGYPNPRDVCPNSTTHACQIEGAYDTGYFIRRNGSCPSNGSPRMNATGCSAAANATGGLFFNNSGVQGCRAFTADPTSGDNLSGPDDVDDAYGSDGSDDEYLDIDFTQYQATTFTFSGVVSSLPCTPTSPCVCSRVGMHRWRSCTLEDAGSGETGSGETPLSSPPPPR